MSKEQVANQFTIDLFGGNKLYYALNNSRNIEICTNAQVQEVLVDNKIIGLTVGNFTIKIGENFSHNLDTIPSSYQVNYIDKFDGNYKNCYYLRSYIQNKSSVYLTPIIAKAKGEVSYNGNLINTYLLENPERIALLYRFSTSEGYSKLEESLLRNPCYDKIISSVPGFDLFIMKVPEKFIRDVIVFQNSKYSTISKELKERIVKFHNLTTKDRTHQVMYRSDDLRIKMEKDLCCSLQGIELDGKLNLENELLPSLWRDKI